MATSARPTASAVLGIKGLGGLGVPLTAFLGDRSLLAPMLSPGDWANLKEHRPRPVLSCGETAIVKTSQLGTQFFAHKVLCEPGHKGETKEHLRVKAAVVEAAAALGWTARAEMRAPDGSWIADVLVEKAGRQVAFEVQISSQDAERYRERQARYERDGIECFWLTARASTEHLPGVPVLRVDPHAEELALSVRSRASTEIPLATFVDAVLEGPLRWAPTPPATVTGTIRWGLHVCDACDMRSIVWDVDPSRKISCDRCALWASGAELAPSAAPAAAAARLGATEPLAVWRERLPGVPSTFECPQCDAEIPPTELWWLYRYRASDRCATRTVALDATLTEPHWCEPSRGLRGAHDVVEHLAGRRDRPRQIVLQETGDLDVLRRDAAQLHAMRAREAQAAAEQREREEAYRRERAERLRLFEGAQPVATPEQLGLPPLTSPKPTTPHERTAAIDAYVVAHPGLDTDDVRRLFPRFTATCDCHDCAEILATYRDDERRILFRPKSRGSVVPRRR